MERSGGSKDSVELETFQPELSRVWSESSLLDSSDDEIS